jgi:hypothetical protein
VLRVTLHVDFGHRGSTYKWRQRTLTIQRNRRENHETNHLHSISAGQAAAPVRALGARDVQGGLAQAAPPRSADLTAMNFLTSPRQQILDPVRSGSGRGFGGPGCSFGGLGRGLELPSISRLPGSRPTASGSSRLSSCRLTLAGRRCFCPGGSALTGGRCFLCPCTPLAGWTPRSRGHDASQG